MVAPPIYLASSSPRRAELLKQIGISFQVVNANVDECLKDGESAEQYVSRLALQKAQAGFVNSQQDRPVLGADTVVIIGEQVLEKPNDKNHAQQMMQALSGQTHKVMTAVALVGATKSKQVVVTTEVTFKRLSTLEIEDYWNTGEPLDKAGGYGIQGIGGKFVTKITGSYSAVVGLPLYETDRLIKEF